MKAHLTMKEMDCWARNERLYRHLLSMGLVVQPVFIGGSKTKIDHLRVSAGTQLSDFVACLSEPTASDAAGGCTLLHFKNKSLRSRSRVRMASVQTSAMSHTQ